MDIKNTDLVTLFEQALAGKAVKGLEEVGIVLQVGDNICCVQGLHNVMYGEVVVFEGGNKGIVMSLDEAVVSVFLLYNYISVAEKEQVRRTRSLFKTPVGDGLLGRVVNAVGAPIDDLGPLSVAEYRPVEGDIPGVIERSPVDEPLQTGVVVVDSLIPIGRGQRELIIGNRATGKTALAVDTILHQKEQGIKCVYVAVGQRQSKIARLVQLLERHGALSYTVVVNASSADPVMNQYLAPYVGTTIAEYFRDKGEDALIVYDDLTSHAIAYREMSLLLKRSPGREAYPGDVFYLHSRLLERSGKLLSGASITALPIAQVQSDDITAYIPTNLISITDGQLFLDTKLFNQGVKPAVNPELSVSRVGGAAQTRAIKQVTKALRLELAQYHDLLEFSQFGTELDEVSQRRLHRGAIAVELLKQPQYKTYSFVDQVLMFFLFQQQYLDELLLEQVREYATQFVSYVTSVYESLYMTIAQEKRLTEATRKELRTVADEVSKIFVPKE